MISVEETRICKECGRKIEYVPRFEGLYCNSYCCNPCCPDAKKSKCQRDLKFGTLTQQLTHECKNLEIKDGTCVNCGKTA